MRESVTELGIRGYGESAREIHQELGHFDLTEQLFTEALQIAIAFQEL